METEQHHKKTLHSKRSFGKHPRSIESPAYDASEEDNDPLTDDAASAVSVPVASRARLPRSTRAGAKSNLAAYSTVSDDGVDSPTYDGDIESSTAARPLDHPPSASHANRSTHQHNPYSSGASSASTLSPASTASPLPTDSSTPPAEIEMSSTSSAHLQGDATLVTAPRDLTPAPESREAFDPASLSVDDIQEFVKNAVDGSVSRPYKINQPPVGRPVRIYADGVYDLFHFGHALQLRQAKLSFPSVHLLVGVCSDELVGQHKSRSVMNHAERLECVRQCRWVDQVVPGAPWVVDNAFLAEHEIDYVAHDEDPYAGADTDDVYSFVKEQGKFLPTRRTPGISTSELLERIVTGYRQSDWDKKLRKMGRADLCAENNSG